MLQGAIDCFRHWWLVLRCSWIGAGFGIIPGIGAPVIDWLAYGHAIATEKGARESFGKGDVRGVIASESANIDPHERNHEQWNGRQQADRRH